MTPAQPKKKAPPPLTDFERQHLAETERLLNARGLSIGDPRVFAQRLNDDPWLTEPLTSEEEKMFEEGERSQ